MKRKWHAHALAGLLVCAAGAAAGAGSPDSIPPAAGVWLGASVREAGTDSSGLEITAVEPGGPAAAAGLQTGDIVVRVDGITVAARNEFDRHVQSRRAGDQVRVAIQRPGVPEQTVVVTLAPRPAEAPAGTGVGHLQAPAGLPGRPRLRVDVVDLDADLADQFRPPGGTGALVTRVEDTGPAAGGGLHTGDILLRIDDQDVHNAAEASIALDGHPDGDIVYVDVWRQQKRQTLRLPVESRAAWLARTRPPAAAAAPAATDEWRREVQKLRRDLEELRREVDLLRRERR